MINKRRLNEFPEKNKKQIVVAADDVKLIESLKRLDEKAQLCLVRANTPDIIAFSGNIRIIDREYLKEKAWNDFCEFLRMVNDDAKYPIVDDDGEILIDEPTYDEVPILIIDENKQFKKPSYAKGGVYYIKKEATELIMALVRKKLKNSKPKDIMIRCCLKEDYKDNRIRR